MIKLTDNFRKEIDENDRDIKQMKNKLIFEKDKDKVVEVLKAKKALLFNWIMAINDLEKAIKSGEDADDYFDDIQMSEDGTTEWGYINGCVDEDDNGISVFPLYRSQVTLHKDRNGNWW